MSEYGYGQGTSESVRETTIYNSPKMAETRDVGHYGQALQEQEKLLAVLSDEVSMLRSRIDPMLRPSVPAATNERGATQATPAVSPLTGVAQTANVKLHSLVIQIRDLSARFDL